MADAIIFTNDGLTPAEAPVRNATPKKTAKSKRKASEPFDFIRSYVDYADIIEAPREAHEVVAMQMLATVLNPRVHIQLGGLAIPLDLWVLLLSPSGLGRNTLVSLARPILETAGLEGILVNAAWGSKQAFYQNISEHPSGLFVWPEMAYVLQNLADPKFAGVKEWVTDRYDNLTKPEDIRYRQTGRKTDTPTIVFSSSPRLNILATSASDWFTTNLSQEDTTGGFVPRWLLSLVRSQSRVVPVPGMPNPDLVRPLQRHLNEVRLLDGVADMSEVLDQYRNWYNEADKRFLAQPNRALAHPFFNRLRTHVVKLAVIYHVSQSLNLRVSPQAMERAIATARACEETIFAFLPTGMNREGSAVDAMAERIRQAGANGLPKSEFTRAFQHIRGSDRETRLGTLQEAETVFAFLRGTSGRRAKILVHKDYLAKYVREFPNDVPG